jgi:uncharacterized DUF497 family protein
MGKTIVSDDGRFEWAEEKDIVNKSKHGLEFAEILPVFDDPYLLEHYDIAHSTVREERFLGIGMLNNILILYVCYTERSGRTRIFSARKAKPREEKLYYEHLKNLNG